MKPSFFTIQAIRIAFRVPCMVTIAVAFFSLAGCIKQDFPEIDDITEGGKWNLEIGDSYFQVYEKLQTLGIVKDFSTVAVIGRTAFDDADILLEFLPYYNWLNFQNTVGQVDRVLFGLDSGRVSVIYAGGAMLDSLDHWPDPFTEGAVIRQGDTYQELQVALEAIHALPDYANYNYILPGKPLELPFDPDMKNYGQWYFTFLHDIEPPLPSTQGRSQVRLYFEDGKLARIHHVYEEFDVVD